MSFDPESVRIRRGGTVVWGNVGASAQEVIDGTGLALFDLALAPSDFGAHTFIAAGRYRFESAADPAMAGAVSVPLTATPTKGSRRTTFEVTWASNNAPTGYAYDIQIRRPGARWRVWKDDVTRAAAAFKADAGTGTYRFRARMVRLVDGSHARWSANDAIRVGS